MKFAPIPDPFAGPAPFVPEIAPPAPHDQAIGRAAVAEHALESALVAIKHRGTRLAHTVQAVTTPRSLVLGTAIAFGLGALVVYAVVRTARPRARGLASMVSRSLAREIVGRAVLGAAGTLGAELAQSFLVPWIVATAARRSAKKPRRARARASESATPRERRGPGTDSA